MNKKCHSTVKDLKNVLCREITLDEPLPGRASNKWNELAKRETLLAMFAQDTLIRKSGDEIRSAILARGNRVH